MIRMDIDRGCTPSPAWTGAVGEGGLALPGAVGSVDPGGARLMSVKDLSR